MGRVVLSKGFVSRTLKRPFGQAWRAKLQLGVNKLFDRHSIVGIATTSTGSTSAAAKGTDRLTVLPARRQASTPKVDL